MKEDGKVIIGTELDTSGFEKDLESQNFLDILEKKFGNSGREAGEQFKKDFENKMKQIEPLAKKYGEMMAEYMELTNKSKGSLIFESDKREIQQLKEQITEVANEIGKIVGEKVDVFDFQDSNKQLKEMNSHLGKVGKSINGIVKSVKKWVLAVFSISGIYRLVTNAISTLSGENEQIANDVEYIKWVIAQTLLPVVNIIIKAAYTVLSVIAEIINELFHFNILLGKSPNDFKKMKKSTSGMASDLKEAKKQLAGFDEMNVLQDTTQSGGGGSGVGDWNPPDFNDYNKKVEELKKGWFDFGESMRTTIKDMPFSVWIKAFGAWGIAIRGVTEFVYGLWQIVTGVVEFVKGALELIVGLVTGDTQKIKQGVVDMLNGLWRIVDGIIHGIVGLVQVQIGIIIGAIGSLIKTSINLFTGLWEKITTGINNTVARINEKFRQIPGVINSVINGILDKLGILGTRAGDVIGGALRGAINGVLGMIERVLNNPINTINSLIGVINKLPIGTKLSRLSTFRIPRLAKGAIASVPGRGIPTVSGGGNWAEAGREAYLPLTDAQIMSELGQSIGKHVTINATIPVYAYNRQVDRQMKRIKAEDGFASNN